MTAAPRAARMLGVSTFILAVTGIALLGMSLIHQPPAPAATSVMHATTDATLAVPARPSASSAPPVAGRSSALTPPTTGRTAAVTDASASPAAPATSAGKPVLAPHGEGVAGDQVVQQALEAAWPADLSSTDEQALLTAGRALLRADATGIGRSRWPRVFPHADQAVAPAFATARFRIQAAIARRDGQPDKAVVHLVWAGMDRGGTFTDLRITDWYFTRSTTKGAPAWTWQPRT